MSMMRRFSMKKSTDATTATTSGMTNKPGVAECGELEVEVIKLRRAVARRHEIDHERNAQEANQIFFLKQLHEDIRIAYEEKDTLQQKIETVAEPRVEKMKFKYEALCERKQCIQNEIDQMKQQTRDLQFKQDQIKMDIGSKKIFQHQLHKFATQVRKRQQMEQSQHDERRIELRQAKEIIPLLEEELKRLTMEHDKLKAPPPSSRTTQGEETKTEDGSSALEKSTGRDDIMSIKEESSRLEELPSRGGRPGLEKRMSQRQMWKEAVREARRKKEFNLVDTVEQDGEAAVSSTLEEDNIVKSTDIPSSTTDWRETVKQARGNVEQQKIRKEVDDNCSEKSTSTTSSLDVDRIDEKSLPESLAMGDDYAGVNVNNELSHEASTPTQVHCAFGSSEHNNYNEPNNNVNETTPKPTSTKGSLQKEITDDKKNPKMATTGTRSTSNIDNTQEENLDKEHGESFGNMVL